MTSKKWRFDIFSSEVGAAETNCQPPPFCLVLLCIQTTRGREKSRWAMVRSAVQRSASQHSDQFPVAGRVECRGWRVLSRARSLSLSYCIAGAALFWADFRNSSTLWHTTQRPGEVSLHRVKVRSKLNGPRYLTYFLDPGWFRVNILRWLRELNICRGPHLWIIILYIQCL